MNLAISNRTVWSVPASLLLGCVLGCATTGSTSYDSMRAEVDRSAEGEGPRLDDDAALTAPSLERAALRARRPCTGAVDRIGAAGLARRHRARAAVGRVRRPDGVARSGAAVDRVVERALRLERDGQPAAAVAGQALARRGGLEGGGRRRSGRDYEARPARARARRVAPLRRLLRRGAVDRDQRAPRRA